MTDILHAALAALERGWNVIPVNQRKRPHYNLVKTGHWQINDQGKQAPRWKDFQTERVTPELAVQWFTPDVPGLAAVTGRISNLVVLDFDGETGRALCASWQLEANALSGSGSPHLYFPHPGHTVPNAASGSLKYPPFPGLDVRGDGGFIVLPPSHLANGRYQERRAQLHDISELPEAAAAWTMLTREAPPTLPEWKPESTADIDLQRTLQDAVERSRTGRDNAGYALARQLKAGGLSFEHALHVMREYASRVDQTDSQGRRDPYTAKDAHRNLQSAYKNAALSPARRRKQRSVPERIRLCLPRLSADERHELSRLYAATLLREGHPSPEHELTQTGLNSSVVETISELLAQNVSVRGAAALERFLKQRNV